MIAAALYRAALTLAPREFRLEYGEPMVHDFQDVYDEEQTAHGSIAAWRYACAAFWNAVWVSLAERGGVIARDLAFSIRTLAKTPLFALVVIVTLGLGIGANAAVFSVIDGVLLRPLPYAHADRLVMLWKRSTLEPGVYDVMSKEDAADAGRAAALDGAGWFAGAVGTIAVPGAEPFRFTGSAMNSGLLTVLGVRAQLGRLFVAGDDDLRAPRVAVLSDRLWRTQFGADPHAVGRIVAINDRPTTIVGVLPPGFLMPNPLRFGNTGDDVFVVLRQPPNQRGSHYLNVVARLRAGVTVEALNAQLGVISARLAAAYPASNATNSMLARPLQDDLIGDIRPALLVVSIAVLALLLVACANVANLLLSRAAARDRELAVRLAVGAPRSRIIAQLITESALLSALGAGLGIALAQLAVRAFVALAPPEIPRLDEVRIDGAVLAFTLLVTLASAVLAGLAPALALSRPNLARALKEGDRGGSGGGGRTARSAFVVVEIALALALVVTSCLLVRGFAALTATDVGFRTDRLVTFTGSGLTRKRYPTQASKEPFYDRLLAQLQAIPGVEAAALGATIPFANDNNYGYSIAIAGRSRALPGHEDSSGVNAVTADYFRTLGVTVQRGRAFAAGDRLAALPVAIVDGGFVRRYFPGVDPLGKRVTITSEGADVVRVVVGVVPSIHSTALVKPDQTMLYIPLAQSRDLDTTDGVIRTNVDPASLSAQIVAAYRVAEPASAPPTVRTYAAVIARETARARAGAFLLGVLAAIAFVLALAGIYAVVSYNVAQRTHEIGIRMALGARYADIAGDVLGRGLRLTGLGIAAGLVVAALAARALGGQLYGVAPYDPLTYAAAVLLILTCAAAASLLPARRATRVDPMIALRTE